MSWIVVVQVLGAVVAVVFALLTIREMCRAAKHRRAAEKYARDANEHLMATLKSLEETRAGRRWP